jgi:uncharacterized iron-regulated membrane protein
MRIYKFFWDTHKWTGIILATLFLNLSWTGVLLLLKKDIEWVQPATHQGAPGEVTDFAGLDAIFEVVLAQGHPAFQSLEDIDRVDFRPDKRVPKVPSVHDHMEMQIDAVTAEILHLATRRSDLFEDLHDGSFFGDWVHNWLMLAVPLGMVFLVMSGSYLWLSPVLRRRKAAAKRRAKPAA